MEFAMSQGYAVEDMSKLPKQVGAIESLDAQLNELDESLDRLEVVLAGVRSQYASDAKVMSEPRPEPATALRGRLERLRGSVNRVRQLASEIDL